MYFDDRKRSFFLVIFRLDAGLDNILSENLEGISQTGDQGYVCVRTGQIIGSGNGIRIG